MATVSDTPSESVAGEKNNATRQAHGLATPEQTPEPDTARLKEDEKRRQAANQATTDQGQGASTGSPPSSGEGAGGATEGNNGATQEQIDAVERVMKCLQTDYQHILGILDKNLSTEDVMAAFKKLGCLTHEKYNKVNHAAEAFHSQYDLLNFPPTLENFKLTWHASPGRRSQRCGKAPRNQRSCYSDDERLGWRRGQSHPASK